ncbi:MAG: hypothetical protein ABFD75_10240 [Smithella sp.]
MTNHASGYAYYYAYNFQSSSQLFGCDEALPMMPTEENPLVTAAQLYKLLRIDNSILIIPPFKIARHKLTYVNPFPLKIDINVLAAAVSRIVVVHNFQVEDCNANLKECLAGIFFAGLVNGQWEQPEDHPVECRTIEIIGVLDKRAGSIYPP